MGRAIAADDLTGAMDSGVQMLGAGPVSVEVSAGATRPPPAGAALLVINTQSRGAGAATAGARLRAACARLRGAGRALWYKKLDSTLRGNVGAELAALHAALAPCTIVCTPALPAQGRTVVAGELRVQGQPVMDTPYRDEIVSGAGGTGAGASAVLDIVRRQWPACRAARLAAPAGDRELAAALRAGADLIVADAASDAHLRQLAAAGRRAVRYGRRLLWAGSAGLLRALAPLPERAGRAAGGGSRELPAGVPLLLVAGSRRALAHAQLRRALTAARAQLSLCLQPQAARSRDWNWTSAGRGGSAVTDRATAVIRSARTLGAGGDLVLWSAPPVAAAGAQSEAVAEALAGLAGDAVEAAAVRPRALLLVGGDTAYACLRRLGIGVVALGGEAEPYVPWGRVIAGPWVDTVVITKAGGFGDPDTLRRICARLLSAAGHGAQGAPAGSPSAP